MNYVGVAFIPKPSRSNFTGEIPEAESSKMLNIRTYQRQYTGRKTVAHGPGPQQIGESYKSKEVTFNNTSFVWDVDSK